MRRSIERTLSESAAHALIYGHTHEPGQFTARSAITGWINDRPIYNTGTWAEGVCTFAEIDTFGQISLYDWGDGGPYPNTTRLPVR
jgi:hypothetical protein